MTPLFSLRPAWADEVLGDLHSRFVEIDGHRIHYLDEGVGPPLLLLHGNPTWSFLYRNVIRALRHRFRVIAPDLPGFGLSLAAPGYDLRPASHARVVEKLVASLDLRGAVLFGHDWGGPIGLWVASRSPERFRGLAIGNSWAWPVDDDPRFRLFSRVWSSPIGRFLSLRANAFVNVMIPWGVRRRRLPRAVMDAYRTPAARAATSILPGEILASRDFLSRTERGLGNLADHPVTFLWADRDPAFGEKELERFRRYFRHSETRRLAGVGHFLPEDAPLEIASAILERHAPPSDPERKFA